MQRAASPRLPSPARAENDGGGGSAREEPPHACGRFLVVSFREYTGLGPAFRSRRRRIVASFRGQHRPATNKVSFHEDEHPWTILVSGRNDLVLAVRHLTRTRRLRGDGRQT